MAVELYTEKREVLGKKSKTLRRQGLLPAVLYGAEAASTALVLPLKSFRKALEAAGESSLVSLLIGGKKHNVLIHDIAVDPLNGLPIHADFLSVRMDKEIRAAVPLEFIGEAPAVKTEGGILVRVMHEVEISALPKDLPHTIQVDLDKLGHINDRITIGDLEAPGGVKIIAEQDDVIALIEAPRSEEELKALESTESEGPVEVVETEREAKLKAEAEKEAAEKAAEE